MITKIVAVGNPATVGGVAGLGGGPVDGVAVFGDGQLVMTLEDGRSAEIMLRSGATPDCGCAELMNETVRIP